MRSFVSAAALVSLFACGSTSTGPGSTGPGEVVSDNQPQSCQVPGRTGQIECGGVTSTAPTCSAGTYCTQDENNFFRCKTGCTSDENCGASERCEKCANTVGRCLPCATSATDACKAPAPIDAGPADPPDEPGSCARSNFEDHWCTNATRGKGYRCDDDAEPAKELNCEHPTQGPSWVYCCAK